MTRLSLANISSVLTCLFIVSCDLTMPPTPAEHDLLDGPMEGLTAGELAQFIDGDVAFNEVFTVETGLGPIFVANQCAGCHPGDGKGHPFVRFTRFGQPDTLGNQFLAFGGPQLQHKAIPGYQPEELPQGASITNLVAPAVTGLGFLDAVSDNFLINLQDPDDLDGDGISGRLHWNNRPEYTTLRPGSMSQNGRYISRFGKKATAYDLLHQTAGAYNQDMGITSEFETIDPFSLTAVEPEVSTQTVNDVVAYLKTLKAPIRRNSSDVNVLAGEQIFSQIDCAKCHLPTMQSSFSPIEVLSDKTFYPYTDLLLHDMGPGLDDGYTEGFALSSEWRTPPLWGLGLSKDAQGGSYFLLHDGRASSIEEAILLHGGEAANASNLFSQLSDQDKQRLIKFLESL